MLDAVKRYATRILLIHLALLVLVIFVVMGAAREVQVSARAEAQAQSKTNVQRLAEQTANGIESNYRAILSTLDVILRDDSTTAATAAATVPATGPAEGRGVAATGPSDVTRRGGQRGFFGRGGRGLFNRPNFQGPVNVNESTFNLLWKQLKGPVSQIFLVDTTNGVVVDQNGLAAARGVASGGDTATGRFTKYVFPQDSFDAATKIVQQNLDWLKGIKDVQMSNFHIGDVALPGAANGYHLIALPALEVNVGPVQGGGNGGIGGRGGRGGFVGQDGNGGGFGRGELGRGARGGVRGGQGPGAPYGGPGGAGPGDGGYPGGPGGGIDAGVQGLPGGVGGPGGPAGPGGEAPKFAVVVVVPVEVAADEFLSTLNTPAGGSGATSAPVNALLVNETGQVLVSNAFVPAGVNLLNEVPELPVQDEIKSLIAVRTAAESADTTDAVVFGGEFHIGQKLVEPQILGASQFVVPSGRRWTVMVLSPLSESDQVVNRLFHSALMGSIVLSLAIAAILASTSFFLINSRVRLERTRHEVLTRELEQARQIQLAWLPDMKSVPAGVDVSAANLPASHISGDFYNWFSLPSGTGGDAAVEGGGSKVAIVIGDVTGHGMAAAFLMATAQLLVKVTLTRWHDPAKCLREVNRQLCTQGFQGQFVTMLVMVFDPVSNTIEVATAGHPTPLVEREGRFESLVLDPQLVLGVDPTEQYKSQSFILEHGASMILYTDGVVEAASESGQQYGVEKLIKVLETQEKAEAADGGDVEPAARIRAVLEDVKRFTGAGELMDDVTMVAIRTSPVAIPAGR